MKTIEQLTKTTTATTKDLVHIVEVANSQDKKMEKSDFHNSKPYCSIYGFSNANQTVISVASTYYDLTNGAGWTTTNGLANMFTQNTATGEITYTGENNITIDLQYSAALCLPSGAIQDVQMAASKNGTPIGGTYRSVGVDGVAPSCNNVAGGDIVSLAKGDVVKLVIMNTTSTQNIIVRDFSLKVTQL